METTNIYKRTCTTKRMAEDDGVQTELSLDCSDLTQRDFIEYALQSLVIKWQGNARRNALKAENAIPIPRVATWRVPKPGVKTQLTIQQQLAALPKAQQKAMLEMLMASLADESEEG